MTIIVFPDQTDIVDKIREAIGRDVYFYRVTYTDCTASGCGFDPVNESSINPYCPTCSGLYFIPSYQVVPVEGFVSWGYSENLGWVQGGQLAEGSCRVQIKSSVTNLDLVNNSNFLIVDNRKMSIVRKTLRGTPNVNRLLLDLQELDDEL